MKANWKQIEKEYKKREWRFSQHTRNLLLILEEYESFLSVQDLEELLREKEYPSSRASIYRILQRLKELNVVVDFFGEWILKPQNYKNETLSHFYVCDYCGRAKIMNLNYYDFMKTHLLQNKDFQLEQAHIRFHGRCEECLEK